MHIEKSTPRRRSRARRGRRLNSCGEECRLERIPPRYVAIAASAAPKSAPREVFNMSSTQTLTLEMQRPISPPQDSRACRLSPAYWQIAGKRPRLVALFRALIPSDGALAHARSARDRLMHGHAEHGHAGLLGARSELEHVHYAARPARRPRAEGRDAAEGRRGRREGRVVPAAERRRALPRPPTRALAQSARAPAQNIERAPKTPPIPSRARAPAQSTERASKTPPEHRARVKDTPAPSNARAPARNPERASKDTPRP